MERQNFISVLTECTGDRNYKCITRCQNSFELLTQMVAYRAAPFAAKNHGITCSYDLHLLWDFDCLKSIYMYKLT